MQTDYHYLSSLSKTEFTALTSILKKHGVKGLLSTVLEIAQFNLNKEGGSAVDQATMSEALAITPNMIVAAYRPDLSKKYILARAERVTRELGALIERLEGFEELSSGQ